MGNSFKVHTKNLIQFSKFTNYTYAVPQYFLNSILKQSLFLLFSSREMRDKSLDSGGRKRENIVGTD